MPSAAPTEKRKSVLIFLTDSSLAYIPSVLGLYDALSPEFDVRVVAYNYFNKFTEAPKHVHVTYLKPTRFMKKALFGINRVMNKFVVPVVRLFNKEYTYQNDLFKSHIVSIGKKYLRTQHPDEVIAVDFVALYAAQQVFDAVHLQALEIYPQDKFKPRADLSRLKSVIAPSEERFEYNFGQAPLRKFIIPNAPSYKEYDRVPPEQRKGLLWAGTISPQFGTHHLLDFVAAHPEHTVTLKGSFVHGYEAEIRRKYTALIEEGRLIINKTYLDNDEFVSFISAHRIGFCFYEWAIIRSNINYWLAPAGRLFMYFAAGVPAIACNTPGLKSVRDFDAGRLIDDYDHATIAAAIEAIEQDYGHVSEGCIAAAKHFSFDTNTQAFIAYLKRC